jgi:hypothetical protein
VNGRAVTARQQAGLPQALQSSLPSIEDIERELDGTGGERT